MKIKGLNEENIKKISSLKKEDQKTLEYRLNCYKLFKEIPLPKFGPTIDLNFDEINYYQTSDDNITNDWNFKLLTLSLGSFLPWETNKILIWEEPC